MKIFKLRADHVLDFAAEELKKYLRMMLPEAGDVEISFNSEATDGFRLGLLEDFSLENTAEDITLDDVVYIDADNFGGILAGSNPRSVLFAVYRFLRLNGCRWLFPGIDGEYIPIKTALEKVSYYKEADVRFRGYAPEGGLSQSSMLEAIDFFTKQEINTFMIEFDEPFYYYNSYYAHEFNEENREREYINHPQVKQWKRMCESVISKRGLQFHDMGHGWTAEPFGISSKDGWVPKKDVVLTDEQKSYLAEIDGKRELFEGVALNTNLCMSNPKVRSIMAKAIADYAESHSNVTYLHTWLADANKNHCECEECRKLRPSDYYVMIMNEVDELLTERGLQTKIVFCAYVDTLFAPLKTTIKNPSRFSLLYGPITRSYNASVNKDSLIPEPKEYKRNAWDFPKSAEENISYLKDWKKSFSGSSFSFEYHFWIHQYFDLSGIYIAKRIFEDIRGLDATGLEGYIQNGSFRSCFPNSLAAYVYAEAMIDKNVEFSDILKDYFSYTYGKDWKDAFDYLSKAEELLPYSFLTGEASKDESISKYYDPSMISNIAALKELSEKGLELSLKHRICETRPQTIAWRLLELHAKLLEIIIEPLTQKVLGNNDEANVLITKALMNFGKLEFFSERYYDHYLLSKAFYRIFGWPKHVPVVPGTLD